MGLALAMIVTARGAPGRGLAIGVFALQLVLNLAWVAQLLITYEVTRPSVLSHAQRSLGAVVVFALSLMVSVPLSVASSYAYTTSDLVAEIFADGGTNCHVLIEEAPPAATARGSLPLPPMQRRSMVPIVHAEPVSVPRQLPAEKREEARGEPAVVAMENFWGRYVDTTV